MPNNISTGDIAIAICDRCNFKFPYLELRADGNSPGLRVCADCWDSIDPYRLPPRQPEPIALRFPRPDISIAVTSEQGALLALYTSVLATELSRLGHNMMAGYQTGGVEDSQ